MEKAGEREALWRRHVEAWRASGGTQQAYCEAHGLKAASLSYWHQRLAKERGAVVAAAAPMTLVPVTITSVVPHANPSLLLHSPGGWRLEFATLPTVDWLHALCGERR